MPPVLLVSCNLIVFSINDYELFQFFYLVSKFLALFISPDFAW